MSTRSTVVAMLADGQYAAIYVHCDGYPDHMLPALAGHATQEAAEALVRRGDMLLIDAAPAACKAFAEGRDAEPFEDVAPSIATTAEEAARMHEDRGGNCWHYLWNGLTWSVAPWSR